MGFAGKWGYISSMPGPPINLPSCQKINIKANIGSLVKWRIELSGHIAPVCVVFLKSYVMTPSEKARNRAGPFQVGLGRYMRGLERG